ncbi:hypothetical protein HK100_008202 [Physocladia obscura]|uniref:Zincin n=1 Tax=Physocladia obscura TaxID=109957 RepID=A0AAD5SNJ9_9FUNG|nr:hypothetical protein HK100_008202 [Physocladia obscura]
MPNYKKTTTKTTTTSTASNGAKTTTTQTKTVYELIAALATLVRPSPHDDFYSYANHSWLTDPNVVIPAENQIGLLQELSKTDKLTVDEAKVVAVWKASLERFSQWAAGVGSYTPAEERLASIDSQLSLNTDEALAAYLADAEELEIRGPISLGQMPNFEDSNNTLLNINAGRLSLPSRDFYFEDNYKEKREFFTAHLKKVVALIGEDRLAPDFAHAVLRFETKLANINMKPTQERDFTKYYTITTLNGLTSGINELKSLDEKLANYGEGSVPAVVSSDEQARIIAFMDALYSKLNLRAKLQANFVKNYPDENAQNAERVLVFDGDYFRRVYAILFDEDAKADLRAYLQYQAISSVSAYCTKELNEEFFDFYSRKLQGQKEQKSEEKRTISLVDNWVGFLLGKVYVSRYFSDSDKIKVSDMIAEVVAVMDASIIRNDWLTKVTKDAAKEKLDSFKTKIGFPDVWRSYDNLVFAEGDSLWDIRKKVSAFNRQQEFWDKINAPVDKTQWEMTPQTVNAYYNPMDNEICFPAAIIQPPFYAKSFDALTFNVEASDRALVGDDEVIVAAANFGGIAAVIAHEITHGFDDQGRQFDNKGNVRDWWTEDDATLFQTKCDLMEKQKWSFVETSTGKTHWTQPKLTMGENLADLGGISLGVQALLKRIEGKVSEEGRKAAMRVFFMSWANVWRKKATDEYMVNQLATDPHSPGEVRANLVKNIDQFYEAFSVKEGDGMFLVAADRVAMW